MTISLVSLSLAGLAARNAEKKATSLLADSIQRMSSGSRLIDLKTDPAARAIFNGLRAEDATLGVAISNAQIMSSLLNTVEGGIEEATSALTQLKELAVSVVDGSLTQTEMDIKQSEYEELLSALDTTAERTRYNSKPLLSGKATDSIAGDVTGFFDVTTEGSSGYFASDPAALFDAEVSGLKSGMAYRLIKDADSNVVSLTDTEGNVFQHAFTTTSAMTFANGLELTFSDVVNTSSGIDFTLTPNIQSYFLSEEFYVNWDEVTGSLSPDQENRVRFPIGFDQGTYFLSSSGGAGSVVVELYKIEDGTSTSLGMLDAASGTTAFTFSNNFEFYSTADIMSGALSSSTAQLIIPKTGEKAFASQVGEKGADMANITLENTSSMAFNLHRSRVDSVSDAVSAQTKIDDAIRKIGMFEARLGAQQWGIDSDIERMGVMRSNLEANMDVLDTADIALEVENIAKYEAISEAAMVAQTKINDHLLQIIGILLK